MTIYGQNISNRASGSSTYSKENFSWLTPFIFIGCVGVIVIFTGAFLFCKCFRTTFIQCFCCCCSCCCADEESRVGDETRDSKSASGSESAGNAQVQPPQPPGPYVPVPQLPPAPYVPPPVPPQATQPARTQVAPRSYKQTAPAVPGRTKTMPLQQSNYATPSTAPPAARQVARTAKIIGNILAFDKGKRRK